LNPVTQLWNFGIHNYTTPGKVDSSPNYSKSNSWLAEKGRQWVYNGMGPVNECGL
jgi:hypothetical protein